MHIIDIITENHLIIQLLTSDTGYRAKEMLNEELSNDITHENFCIGIVNSVQRCECETCKRTLFDIADFQSKIIARIKHTILANSN
jgi:hypothetical protein